MIYFFNVSQYLWTCLGITKHYSNKDFINDWYMDCNIEELGRSIYPRLWQDWCAIWIKTSFWELLPVNKIDLATGQYFTRLKSLSNQFLEKSELHQEVQAFKELVLPTWGMIIMLFVIVLFFQSSHFFRNYHIYFAQLKYCVYAAKCFVAYRFK